MTKPKVTIDLGNLSGDCGKDGGPACMGAQVLSQLGHARREGGPYMTLSQAFPTHAPDMVRDYTPLYTVNSEVRDLIAFGEKPGQTTLDHIRDVVGRTFDVEVEFKTSGN